MTRLLIIACSARKRPDAGLLPAIDRYEGPWYRTLRKFRRAYPGRMPDVWILSGEFGLIPGWTPIPDYNRMMTPQRALALRDQIGAALQRAINPDTDDVLICAGKVYVDAILAHHRNLPAQSIRVAPGGIGTKMGHLKRWLHAGATPRKSVD